MLITRRKRRRLCVKREEMHTRVEGRVLALQELFLDTDVICQSSVSLKGYMSPKALLKASPLVSHVQAI